MPHHRPPTIHKTLDADPKQSALQQISACCTQTSSADAKLVAEEGLARAGGLAGICAENCGGDRGSVEDLKFVLETLDDLVGIAYIMLESWPAEAASPSPVADFV